MLSKGGVVVSYHLFVCFLDLILRGIFAHTKKLVIVGTHDDEEGVKCIVGILPGGKDIWRGGAKMLLAAALRPPMVLEHTRIQ